MSQASYPDARPVSAIAERLRDAVNDRTHQFWRDDVSLLDDTVVDMTRVHGPRQLADVYLLALAVTNKGRLVTFDGSIALSAVKGATSKHIVVL